MANASLARRVEILEETVDALAGLPARVTSIEARLTTLTDEFVSFRAEVREEFGKIGNEFGGVRQEFGKIGNEFGGVRQEFGRVREEFGKVREEMRAGDEETRRQMRVLHEDVISRTALLQEGFDRRNGRGTPSARRNPPRRKR